MYNIELNDNDMQVLNLALIELPYKIAAPLIDKINKQIAEDKSNK